MSSISYAGGGANLDRIVATFWYTAAVTDATFFISDRSLTVVSIQGRVDVAGTGGACTAQIRKAASGTAITSGTLLHSSTYNLVGSVNTLQTLTLSTTASDLTIPAGTAVCFDVTGTATSAVGMITVVFAVGG